MKTIETIFSYDEGKVKECKSSGIIKESKYTINIDHIVSVSLWVGQLIHKGRTGTQIKVVNGSTYLDDRNYDDFIEYLRFRSLGVQHED